ncbi:TIGR03086 family metal-binding protein [Actinokineospora pegani]|uniref:TIGR03086 family metal-binding protein n=1 Tax=Actinokineospora pegani TaxID=2654637 RepID=UPI0018D294AA|nr:TIGR03086 family metal-binding protein [Actinokineospora pegani]
MDIRTLDLAAIASTGAFIDVIEDGQWDLPSPCTEWTVRGVVEHMVANNRRTLGHLGVEFDGTGDPRADFHSSAAALHAQFADETVLTRPFPVGPFELSGAQALGVHFFDVLVHGWDVGVSLGHEVVLDERLAAAALEVIGSFPEHEAIYGPSALFAGRLAVAEDATAQERLLARTGRRPGQRGA